MRLAYRDEPGPRRGFHVPHSPRPDRRGCPLYPGATVFSRPAVHHRSPLPLPCGGPYPQRCLPHPGVLVTRHQTKVSLALTRPVFPLPVAPVWSGRPWAFPPMLRTPPLPATHVRVGTDLEHFSEAHCRLHPDPPVSEPTRAVRPRVAVNAQGPSPRPDDGLRHRIQLVIEVASGPGVEVVAAQLLLDVVQTLTYQGLIPASVALRIASVSGPGR